VMIILHNLRCLIQSAKAGFFAILACGFMMGLLWSGADVLWSHFSPGFGTVAQVFVGPNASAGGIQAVQSFVSGQKQVHDVEVVSAKEGAKYIQEHVMQTQSAIDAEGLPVRLVVTFDEILSPHQKTVFEEGLAVFAQVDTVIFNHINSQQSLWGILGALFCFSSLALYFMIDYLRHAPAHSHSLYEDLTVYRHMGVKWSMDWMVAFVLFILIAQSVEWALMLLGSYIFYIPQQSTVIPMVFVLLMSILWLKKTINHVDILVQERYNKDV
jgi:hypothetical protein